MTKTKEIFCWADASANIGSIGNIVIRDCQSDEIKAQEHMWLATESEASWDCGETSSPTHGPKIAIATVSSTFCLSNVESLLPPFFCQDN